MAWLDSHNSQKKMINYILHYKFIIFKNHLKCVNVLQQRKVINRIYFS